MTILTQKGKSMKQIKDIEAEVARYREALEEIAKGGYACNFQKIAKSALQSERSS